MPVAQSLYKVLAVSLCIVAARAHAAVPVEESLVNDTSSQATIVAGSRASEQRPDAASMDAYSSGGAGDRNPVAQDGTSLSNLFYRLQILQQEVQSLRGMVEEQQYLLNRLQQAQKEQYLDLDARLNGAALPKGNNPSANSPNPAAGNPVNPVRAGNDSFAADRPGVATPVAPVAAQWASEREAYAAARQSLTDRDFAAAVAQMEGLIVNYPNGQYTPDAFYWLGELYLAQQETERARQQFTQVINLYPDHQKVPDALFKLGVVYSNLGDSPRAKQFFNEVISQHPRSSAANLAAKYQEALE